jgi:hypothetical protein
LFTFGSSEALAGHWPEEQLPHALQSCFRRPGFSAVLAALELDGVALEEI